jgi:hypothetical protein
LRAWSVPKKGRRPAQRARSTDADQENLALLTMLDAMQMGVLFVNSKHWGNSLESPPSIESGAPAGGRADRADSEPVRFP